MAELIIPYQPRVLQQELHNDPTRFKVLVWHRRAGKTVWAINEAILKAIKSMGEDKPRPRVAYIAPLLKQARTVAWDYAKEFTSQLPGYKPNEGNLHIDFLDGCRLNLYGSDNPDAARGIYLDFVVMDEYAQMSPNMWTEIIRPALSDRQGSAAFIGTPKAKILFIICTKGPKTRKQKNGLAIFIKLLRLVTLPKASFFLHRMICRKKNTPKNTSVLLKLLSKALTTLSRWNA
tara:strand:- start:537 stop:1235 length:699 start_codon:yes stop_codon:yes gene_type:complete